MHGLPRCNFHTLLYISISHCRRIPGQQIAETNLNCPHIAVISMNFSVNMFLVECEIVCRVKSVFQAVQLLLSAHYVFNISYHKLLDGLFVCFFWRASVSLDSMAQPVGFQEWSNIYFTGQFPCT